MTRTAAAVTTVLAALTLAGCAGTTEASGPTVPQSCLDALDAADTGFTLAGKSLDLAAGVITSGNDDTVLDDAMPKMQKINDQLRPVVKRYTTNREECRAAAQE